MEEIFKTYSVVSLKTGKTNIYEISNLGRIKKNGKPYTKPTYNTETGYLQAPGGKGKTLYIHRLVAEYFIDNPEEKPCVDHIDTNKLNNNVTNLRWCTTQENHLNPLTRKHHKHNLQHAYIYEYDGKIFTTIPELQEHIGLTRNGVSYMLRKNKIHKILKHDYITEQQ